MFLRGTISWGIFLATLGFGGVILAIKCLMGYIFDQKCPFMGHDFIKLPFSEAFMGYILTYFPPRKI